MKIVRFVLFVIIFYAAWLYIVSCLGLNPLWAAENSTDDTFSFRFTQHLGGSEHRLWCLYTDDDVDVEIGLFYDGDKDILWGHLLTGDPWFYGYTSYSSFSESLAGPTVGFRRGKGRVSVIGDSFVLVEYEDTTVGVDYHAQLYYEVNGSTSFVVVSLQTGSFIVDVERSLASDEMYIMVGFVFEY